MTTLLKLGGSVITEKERAETLDGPALEAAANAIGGVAGRSGAGTAGAADLVVVHGGGSFGHHAASAHGVTREDGTNDPDAVLEIHAAMHTLNRFVLDRLRDAGVPSVPVHPLSAGHRNAEAALGMPTDQVATMLAEGFVPVLHGDVIAHAGEGATIVSGDELVAALAGSLGADRVGLCSTVPGVLDVDGEVIDRIDRFAAAAEVLGGSDATDVTGGMAGKVETLLGLSAPASIFGLDALESFLAGEDVGTTVDGRP